MDWKPEVGIAIYAAFVSTVVGTLQVVNYFRSGVRLKLSVMPDGVVAGGNSETDERDLVVLTVINRGGAPTTIGNMLVIDYGSRWGRFRSLAKKSYIIPHPQLLGYPPIIPSLLKPAEKWMGVVRKRHDVIPDIRTGNFYVGVSVSHRDRPYLIRIPPRA